MVLSLRWGCREHFVGGCWHSSGRDRGRYTRECWLSTLGVLQPGVPVMCYGHIRDLFPTAEGCMGSRLPNATMLHWTQQKYALVGCDGTVVGGWLVRVFTILHITLRCIPHSTSASFLWFAFLSVVFLHTMFLRVFGAFPSWRWSGCAALDGCRTGLWISPHPVWMYITSNHNVSLPKPESGQALVRVFGSLWIL